MNNHELKLKQLLLLRSFRSTTKEREKKKQKIMYNYEIDWISIGRNFTFFFAVAIFRPVTFTNRNPNPNALARRTKPFLLAPIWKQKSTSAQNPQRCTIWNHNCVETHQCGDLKPPPPKIAKKQICRSVLLPWNIFLYILVIYLWKGLDLEL